MRTKMLGWVLGASMLMLFQAVTAQAAMEFYVSVVGAKQGPFKGETLKKGLQDKIPGQIFDFAILSPRDPATGQATGRRQHKPIRITKAWGAASTQFFAAAVTNEVLPTVIIDFFSTSPTGQMVLDHSIKLTNAAVASIAHHSDTGLMEDKLVRAPASETIELVFSQIELIDHLNKGVAVDQWMGASQ